MRVQQLRRRQSDAARARLREVKQLGFGQAHAARGKKVQGVRDTVSGDNAEVEDPGADN